MCGVAGIVRGRGVPAGRLLEPLRAMGGVQRHRGPDAWGEWADDGVALGHNRLSIIDLEGGVQPMATEDGAVRVVLNGEIYNHRELRSRLEGLGHRFRTRGSDTEVVLRGYREWGTGLFERLEGMFALAVWDAGGRRLVLARDRFGIKPLYYAETLAGLAFASEPKALIAAGWVEPGLEASGLMDYFHFRVARGPRTLFRGVHKLPAAAWAEWTEARGLSEPRAYWSLQPGPMPYSLREAERKVEEALERAVVSHMDADVPVGLFLSGGVDSGLVAALAARHGTPRAFAVGVDGPLDETAHATAVARHLGIELRVRPLAPADFLARFDAWVWHNDDPVADPSALALMVLSEAARAEGFRVMLAGEGADELFGGYRSYLRYAAARRLPRAGLARALAGRRGGLETDYLRTPAAGPARFLGSAHAADHALRRRVLAGPDADARVQAWEATAFDPPVRSPDALREAMLVDQAWRLPDDVLARTDRATMAASLEARVPFLDRQVAELANALPSAWSLRLLPPATKRLLKRIAARHVPRETVYRPKRGFNLPVDRWLRGEFRDRIEAALDARAIPELSYDGLGSLYRDPRGGQRWAAPVWAWLVLEEWHRTWIREAGSRRAEVAAGRGAGDRESAAAPREGGPR